MCNAKQKAELDKHRDRLEKEAKWELFKLGKRQIEQKNLLKTMQADKKYIDTSPIYEFSENERVEFLEIFQQKLTTKQLND